MASDHDALFQAILAKPDDDQLRLVYADWQEEYGDPRYAQFIRAQVATAGVPEYEPIGARVRCLPNSVGFPADFEPPNPPLPEGLEWLGGNYLRGFSARVYCRGIEPLLRHAEELFAIAPVEEVELVAEGSWRFLDLSPLVTAPWFARIRTLEVSLATLETGSITELQNSPYATQLTELNVETCSLSPHALEELFRPPLITRLHRLAVHVRDENVDFAAFVKAAGGPHQLRALRLCTGSNHDSPAHLIGTGVLDAPLFRGLAELDLSNNLLGLNGISELANSSAVVGLKSLALDWTRIGGDAVAVLSNSPSLAGLRRLKLQNNALPPAAAVALAQSSHLAGLRVLSLDRNAMDDAAAGILAESPHLDGLIDLDLGFNQLGDPAALALMASPLADTLIHLRLVMNKISGPMKRKLKKRFGDRVRY